LIKNNNKNHLKSYAKYSGIAFQMIAIILIGLFAGIKIDKWLSLKFPAFTIILSILSIIFAVYFSIKDQIK